jgi:hypothetical protein
MKAQIYMNRATLQTFGEVCVHGIRSTVVTGLLNHTADGNNKDTKTQGKPLKNSVVKSLCAGSGRSLSLRKPSFFTEEPYKGLLVNV